MYDASKNHTREAVQKIINTTAKVLSRDDWIKFKQLPSGMQAHLLCEAYLATLRDRTLPGAKKVEEDKVAEEETPATGKIKGKYASRFKLRTKLRAFYEGTGRILYLYPKRFEPLMSTQELRDVVTKIASNFAPGWYKTEMPSQGGVVVIKLTKVQMAKKAASLALPVKVPKKQVVLPGLREDMEKFFASSEPLECLNPYNYGFEPSNYDEMKRFRDKVSSMAHSFARGKYSTEITETYDVILRKKA